MSGNTPDSSRAVAYTGVWVDPSRNSATLGVRTARGDQEPIAQQLLV